MLRWQGETLAPEQLDFYRRPYHPGYFTDGSGKPLNRTVFDYLCNHLGDRLHLLDCRIHRDVKNKGFTHEICFMLLNTGFALPYPAQALRRHHRAGRQHSRIRSVLSTVQLASREKASFIVPVRAGEGNRIGIQLSHPLPPELSARFADARPFENGCNLVGIL